LYSGILAGLPNSKDGSWQGRDGDVDLSGMKGACTFVWPRAIDQSNGRAAFILHPA
jgi:hypothetical protein